MPFSDPIITPSKKLVKYLLNERKFFYRIHRPRDEWSLNVSKTHFPEDYNNDITRTLGVDLIWF